MSRRIRLILMAAGIFILGGAIFLLVLNPMRSDISSLKTQISDEETKISQAKIELAAAENTRNEGRRNEARLMELAKMIPADAEVSSLILQIQDLADKAGIKWMEVSFSGVNTTEGSAVATMPITLQFSGTFYNVTDFVYRAEKMASGPGRLLTVKDIALTLESETAGTSRSPALGVHMTLYAFVVASATTTTK